MHDVGAVRMSNQHSSRHASLEANGLGKTLALAHVNTTCVSPQHSVPQARTALVFSVVAAAAAAGALPSVPAARSGRMSCGGC